MFTLFEVADSGTKIYVEWDAIKNQCRHRCKFLNPMKTNFSSPPPQPTTERLGQVVGCKWSVSILQAIRHGTCRPGALERQIVGISAKVLSERLRKLTDYGLLKEESFPEVPPRTEYHLTAIGRRLTDIIDQLHDLDRELVATEGKHRRPAYFVPAGHP